MKTTNTKRRTFWWTVFVALVAILLMDTALWFSLKTMDGVISPLIPEAPGLPAVTAAIEKFNLLEYYFLVIGMPSSFILFLMLTGSVRLVYRKLLRQKQVPVPTEPAPSPSTGTAAENARKKANEQRLFLNLISVLQREGRLIDFFAEDLDTYNDDQIGAAVREIHATCRRVVEKRLSLKPVIQSMEGEPVTVEPGFDPGTIKLVGNVSGDPPFTGVLRHRGWQAGKMDMPTFSGDQEPGVIAPAEVEIQ
jgi:hypothetical protein